MIMLKKLFTIVLCIYVALYASASISKQHGKQKTSDGCSDVSVAANIKCATAPSAIFDEHGRLWAAWAYAGHVYVNYSDNEGKSFSQARVVNRTPENISARGENRPKIKLDSKGKIFVSWTTPLKKRFSGHVRFSYSIDGGLNFSEPVIINNHLEETGHRFDALGVNSKGDIYIAWLDKRDRLTASKKGEKYHGASVYFTWSDDGGKTFKADKKIIDHSCECCRVIIDFDENDLPVILWRNIYDKNTRDHALVRFKDKNTPFKPERVSFDMWQVDACPHHGPDMSINDTGDYHLVWFNNADERHGLFYGRRDLATGLMSKPVNFGDYSKAASHPTVLHDKKNVWISWKQFDGKNESIWVKKSGDDGTTWAEPTKLSSTSRSSDYAFLIKHKNKVYVQWKTDIEGYQLIRVNK